MCIRAAQVRARLGFLKERLTRTIGLVLDAESQPPPHGRWRSVWEKARAFVTRQDQDAALQHKLVSQTFYLPTRLYLIVSGSATALP